MEKIKRTFYFILLSLIVSLISCQKENTESLTDEMQKISVTAGNPVKKSLVQYLDLNATTTFQKQEIIRATLTGFIEKTFKNLGDGIKKDDLLFQVKTKEASAVDSLDLNSLNTKFTGLVNIYSHSSGILTELNHQTGDYISEGDQLALIVEPQSLRILVNIPYQYTKSLSMSGSYEIKLPDERNFDAKLSNKIPSIDAVNQTQTFILVPTKQISIPANLNLVVRIPQCVVNNAIVLPKSAVMTDETQTEFWIMKIVNDSIAIKQDIKKGIETDSLVQILQPQISLSDKFIFVGGYGLPDTANIILKDKSK
jgi:hypothetical protein